MKKLGLLLAALSAVALYFLAWPTGVDPVAWTPPPVRGDLPPPSDALKNIQRLGDGVGIGPEAVNVDATGRFYAGYNDGRVVQFSGNGSRYTELADTGGRPLGLTFGPNGGIVVADAKKGLMLVGRKLMPLTSEADGVPFLATNDADNTVMDKNIYFTDSSSKFPMHRYADDLLEHGANGRLLQYNVATEQTHVLLKNLHFPNGVAVGPDDAYVLVCEMAEYRVLRYWLKGDKAGTSDVFVDGLPGFPDNISYNNHDRFWLALAAPRDAMLDSLLPGEFAKRRLLSRFPTFLQPQAQKRSMVLGLDLEGHVIKNLDYAGSDAYAPITSVREWGPWLYFGSLTERTIGRLPLNQVIAGAPQPPANWEEVPQAIEAPLPKSAESEREEEEEEREEKMRQRMKLKKKG